MKQSLTVKFSFSVSDVRTGTHTQTPHSLTPLLPGKDFPAPTQEHYCCILFLFSRRLYPRNSYHLARTLRLTWHENSTQDGAALKKILETTVQLQYTHFAAITNILNFTQHFFPLLTKRLVFLVSVMIISYRIFRQLILFKNRIGTLMLFAENKSMLTWK